MAFPSVAATNIGSSTSAATSHTVNLPASIASGDLLIVLFAHKDDVNGCSFPAGWTKFKEAIQGSGSNACLAVAWRKADGTEGSTITVTTVASSRQAHASRRITGAADPTVTAPEALDSTGTNTANPDPPSLTPTGGAKDYLWIAAFASSHGRITSSLPTNYSTNVGDGSNSGTATHVGIGSGTRQLNAASEDPGTFTTTAGSVEEVASLTIAIHPAAGSNITMTADVGTFS